MRNVTVSMFFVVVVASVGLANAGEEKQQPDKSVTRIGVYDSRSIAIGFVGSEVYRATAGRELEAKVAELQKAKADGNEADIAKLQAWGQAGQARAHRQAFSTAPVDNILEHIKDQLPAFLKRTNVDLLVSKWDKNTLAKHQSVEQVDVTMELVDVFKPNQKQREMAEEIRSHKPIPLAKMKDHKH